MDFESVKKLIEKQGDHLDSMPERFIDPIIMQGLKIDCIQCGHILCTFTVPPRLVNAGNSLLHSGAMGALVDLVGSAVIFTTGAATSGVSIEINVSYLDDAHLGEEMEIDAMAVRVGKAIAVVTVELRNKKTGKVVAVGRHTKYLLVRSKI